MYGTNKTCAHIRITGETCGCYALTDSEYCYWHLRGRNAQTNAPRDRRRKRNTFILPLLEDANSIQLAIQMVLQALANRTIERAAAATFLYGIQVAAINVKSLKPSEAVWTLDLDETPRETPAGGVLDEKSRRIPARY